MPNWSKEHFVVDKVPEQQRGTKRRVYKIKVYNDEAVKRTWYPENYGQQIIKRTSPTNYSQSVSYRESFAPSKSPDGTNELLVKWESWPEKFNFLIKQTDKYNVAG